MLFLVFLMHPIAVFTFDGKQNIRCCPQIQKKKKIPSQVTVPFYLPNNVLDLLRDGHVQLRHNSGCFAVNIVIAYLTWTLHFFSFGLWTAGNVLFTVKSTFANTVLRRHSAQKEPSVSRKYPAVLQRYDRKRCEHVNCTFRIER